ncbi:putative hydrolases of HD superfamily [Ruminococcaceae bacterium YRB3002]|nr:putative hydrolases of HD superfamily [Ruminococcaceae bacterium YRB3002]
MIPDRLRQQFEFALELDKEKNILRQTHLSSHGRRENDAEHAWHMALMAYLLREYSNEPIDIAKVMIMCLIHDVVEIDAGDTYCYDPEALATQREREIAARDRIFGMLPDDQRSEFISLFEEFEAGGTPESRFAHSMDNMQPLLLNDSNDGGDWREHDVAASQVYGRHKQTRLGSEALYAAADEIIKKHIELGNLRM